MFDNRFVRRSRASRVPLLRLFSVFLIAALLIAPIGVAAAPDSSSGPLAVRFATFNASLNRNIAGQLVSDLSTPNNAQAKTVAEIIQRTRPDVLLINEFDFVENGQAARLFQTNYLSVSQNGAQPINYPNFFVAPSNTGVPSGFDLNNNGVVSGPDDAFGFGFFPGQFGMAVYSRYPIDYNSIRTFQMFLWKDMPGAKLPDDPNTPAPADWYSPAELDAFRLSSKSHWDIPIQIDNKLVHFLASHPTPPVFDGPEDRNGTRNFDEIRFWSDYLLPSRSGYIYDDQGNFGGLEAGAMFVIAGDQNSDPLDGDSIPGSIQQLLNHPLVNTKVTPSSAGATQQALLQGGANTTHRSNPAFDTADFADSAPGNLRADYVLPMNNMQIVNAAVFWPVNTDPLFSLVGVFTPGLPGGFPSSDHRLVWIDVRVPGTNNDSGFKTSQPSMLTPVMSGVQVTPLLTVGDVLPSGYRFEAVPDGISLQTRGQGRVDLFVNHETSKVPFPYNTANPLEANGENDFDNAQVSHLILNQHSAGVLNGSFAIDSSSGYQRFCSNYLATSKEGFDRNILFTNEEAIDYVFRQEASWPPPIGNPAEKQIGLVVALDVSSGEHFPIYGMGRHNHENSVPIPGFDDLVVLSGDDTFTNGPLADPTDTTPPIANIAAAQSQLYSYIAPDTDTLLADGGDLWAFVVDTPGYDDYYDFTPGSTQVVTGHFIPVPKNIATGLNNGAEIKAADVGFPLPPNGGSWQRDNRTTVPTGLDGPQWVLEYWSQINNVFRFVRVEDIAYDKRPGHENEVYIVDSGRGTTGPIGAGKSTNGRVWKMVFNPSDPTQVTSLTVFVDGDDSQVQTLNEVHQPDNIETTMNGILLTEDPGSSQQFPVNSPLANATTARLMWVPFVGSGAGAAQTVVKVDQSADGVLPINGGTDVDGRPNGNWGAWESTGIVDASEAFGPGYFLINIQAATLWVERAPGEDNFAPAGPDFTYKRSGGQLLLIYIPGF